MNTLTILSLVAAGLYAIVALFAGRTALVAGRTRQPGWHRAVWLGVAIFFVLLVVWRVLLVEELLRGELRNLLRGEQAYDDRRAFQSLLASGVLALVAAVAFALLYRIRHRLGRRRDRLTILASGCCGAMVILVAARLISFHWIDAILYGPLKLNWFADLGLSLAVIVASVLYWRVVEPPSAKWRTR